MNPFENLTREQVVRVAELMLQTGGVTPELAVKAIRETDRNTKRDEDRTERSGNGK